MYWGSGTLSWNIDLRFIPPRLFYKRGLVRWGGGTCQISVFGFMPVYYVNIVSWKCQVRKTRRELVRILHIVMERNTFLSWRTFTWRHGLEIVHIQEHNNGVMIASYSEITFLDESYRWMTIFLTLEMKIRSVQHKQEVSSRKRKVFIYCIFLTDIFIKAKNLLTK